MLVCLNRGSHRLEIYPTPLIGPTLFGREPFDYRLLNHTTE